MGTSFQDWGFGVCGYVPGAAHLGADSSGAPAGRSVKSIASGVVRAVESGWPGDAVGIEHVASDGTHFLAVYGHIVRSVGVGQTIDAGQVIGTVFNDGSNSHLHFGVQAPYSSSDLRGQSACSAGSVVQLYGYTNPMPWLASHAPRGSAVNNLPQGTYDLVSSPAPGEVAVRGWAFDRDDLSRALAVHVYVGGRAGTGAPGFSITANTSRPDVNAAFPGVGSNHGFDHRWVPGRTGTFPVCVYAISIGGGTNPELGCKNVTVRDPNPIGHFDDASSPVGGKVYVRGWTFDPNAPTVAGTMHVYVGGTAGVAGAEGHSFVANAPRPDVDAVHHTGINHGLELTFATAKRGVQQVCIYGINVGPGTHVAYGCKTVTIAEPPVVLPPPTGIRWSGTSGANVKSGTAYTDVLRGLGGNDTLRGLGGGDRLFGGSGADRIEGGAGSDAISGGLGRDLLIGGTGNDLIDTRDGVRDTVYCGAGTDRVNADAIDRLIGCERRTTLRVR